MEKTCLYHEHELLKAQIVPFAGFLMPLQYQTITSEHEAVRHHVGLFDVSHMGEILITGAESYDFVNYLVTNNVPEGPFNKASYALLCNDTGHVIDDLFVYPIAKNRYLLVVNASNTAKDEVWIRKQAHAFDVEIKNVSNEYGQLALQGPLAEKIIYETFSDDLTFLKFMQYQFVSYQGSDVMVSRSGYTGEDGFELYAKSEVIVALWKYLIAEKQVIPCGLGARDTLRFEAALSLYGHEIDDLTTPLEAGLKFAINFSKDFIGKNALIDETSRGPARKLVGLEVTGRGIARADYEVFVGIEKIGKVTTGYLLAGHQKPLALALIKTEYATLGQTVSINIRGNMVTAVVRDTKFMDKKYKR